MAWNKLRNKRGVSLLTALTFSLSLLGGISVAGINVKAKTPNISNPRITEDGTVTWDKVEFGSYYQDINEVNIEPIKWRILSVNQDGTDAFLLADKIIDARNYNDEQTDVTWETCSLRKWLNDEEDGFLKMAFTEEELSQIKTTRVENNDISSSDKGGGNNTNDKVYLLSLEEATNNEYGFVSKNYTFSQTRYAKASDYAFMNGVYRENNETWDYDNEGAYVKTKDRIGNSAWWLRSPGDSNKSASFMTSEGWLNDEGGKVYNEVVDFSRGSIIGVRPAIHVNLNSSSVRDAGKISSDGKVILPEQEGYSDDGYIKPEINDTGITTWDCVYFGNYKQSVSFEKKPIEWRVLSVDENKAKLITDKAIDCKQYNDTQTVAITWEKSPIREWLNDNDNGFIKDAFSATEIESINTVNLVNDDNPFYNTDGGNDTIDKVYLLSMDEASKLEYGFDNSIFDDYSSYISPSRQAKVTDYAYIKGAYRSSEMDYLGNCYWWLRSPGDHDYRAILINNTGMASSGGYVVDKGSCAVRPVIEVNIKTTNLTVKSTVTAKMKYLKVSEEEQQEIDAASKVDGLISSIGTVTKDSKAKIEEARAAYEALSVGAKSRVSNYAVLQKAEGQLKELESVTSSSVNGDVNSNSSDKNNAGNNSNPTAEKDSNVTETPKDNTTTFNIKNKKTYKKSQKVTIKDEDGIKSIVFNSKKVKFKKGKKSVSFKLSSYKKSLKKKNKWNKIIVTDVNGNKKTIFFKVK